MEVSVALSGPPDTMPGWPPFLLPPLSGAFAYGWRSDSTDVGLRFGAGAGGAFQLELDAYLQFPRRLLLGLDGGVGVGALLPSLAATAPMPYAELGRMRSDRGPYVILGYIHQPTDTNRIFRPGAIRRTDGWATTLAYQLSDGVIRARPFATVAVGRRYIKECMGKYSDCSSYAPPREVFVGLSLERSLRP